MSDNLRQDMWQLFNPLLGSPRPLLKKLSRAEQKSVAIKARAGSIRFDISQVKLSSSDHRFWKILAPIARISGINFLNLDTLPNEITVGCSGKEILFHFDRVDRDGLGEPVSAVYKAGVAGVDEVMLVVYAC